MCSGAIENHFNKNVEGIKAISVSLITSKALIKHDLNSIRPRKIISEIEDLGFGATFQPANERVDIREITRGEVRKYRSKFIITFLLYIPLLVLIWIVPNSPSMKPFMTSVQLWNGNTLYILICAICSTIIQFHMGKGFYNSAYKSVKHKSANMDVLIVVGTTAAWAYGIIRIILGYNQQEQQDAAYAMSIHSHVHNFETASVLIMIVILGKFIESYSKMKTVGQLSNLASLKVSKANLIKSSEPNLGSAYEEIAVELLELKDKVLVSPGGAIPTDGTIVVGRGYCNEAMLTGEALLVQKEIGMKVYGGAVLTQGSIILQVDKTAENATFNQIMKLVENAQNTKAPI